MNNKQDCGCAQARNNGISEYREQLLITVNKAAEILLTANEEDTMSALMSAMELVGICVDADRVQIWRNEVIDGELHFVMRYEWLSELGKQKEEVPLGLKFPYREIPEWLDMFLKGDSINSPISQLPPRDAAFLGYYEMVSIVCLPLFLNKEFIGFFSVDDCRYEKEYTTDEMSMFASVGLMFTRVFNRVLQAHEREVLEQEKAAMELAGKLIERAPIFIEYWNPDGTMIDCNEKLINTLGVSSRAEYAERWFDFSTAVQPCGTQSQELIEKMLKAALSKGTARCEWTFILPDGEILSAETTWVHITHREISMIVLYGLDSRPIRAAVEAEESSRAKTRFLARMSHEIRTPISAVLGISEIQLRTKVMPPQTEDAFVKIYDSSKTLLSIVNDILDFSKIESGKMSILVDEYYVASLVSDVAQLHQVYSETGNVAFKMRIDENMPVILLGDVLRVKQIINNLLTNAFKYTSSGSVTVALNCETTDADGLTLVICIHDTGMGMPAEQIEEMRSREFIRLHEKERPFVGGTGLGIPIVFSLVQAMDAHIDIKSEVGMGTRAVVRIPQKSAGSKVLGKEMADKLQNFEAGTWSSLKEFGFVPEPMPYGKVLVVDDVDVNLYVAEAMLEFFSLNTETVKSGQAAIDKIERGNVYDIIFMDHMMPEMDGIQATKKMREMGYTRPIVALTANALKGQAEMFMNNGFSGFLSKPLEINNLNSYLIRFIKNNHPEGK
ncbi:MAG: response regulator [Defluviitaleaceae bacterium]|nr:response regulator [Defluviitaleaceae bacterium]